MLLFIFVQYAARLGMKMSYQFHDVFGLDSELLAMVPQPCIALLLLYPINEKVHRLQSNGKTLVKVLRIIHRLHIG